MQEKNKIREKSQRQGLRVFIVMLMTMKPLYINNAMIALAILYLSSSFVKSNLVQSQSLTFKRKTDGY